MSQQNWLSWLSTKGGPGQVEAVVAGFIILGLLSLLATFRAPATMYWIGIIGLHFQALFLVYQYEKLITFAEGQDVLWTNGQKIALWVSIAPFVLPAALAYLTGEVTGEPVLAVASFSFWSIVQVVIHGQRSNQEALTKRVGEGIRFALPVLAFIVNLLRALNP